MQQIRAIGPLISVLIPVRSGAEHLGEAIDSIAGQTLVDWELIVIDNTGSDLTEAYVRPRAAEDPRIVLYRSAGDDVSNSLSIALALSSGDWIATMDASDRAMPNRLERQLAFMLQNRDVAVVTCLAQYIDAHGEAMEPLSLEAPYGDPDDADDFTAVLHRGAFMRRETLANAVGDSGAAPWSSLAAEVPVLVQPECLMQYRFDDAAEVARLDLAQQRYLWAAECVLAFREGNKEPTWEQFLWRQRSRPVMERLDHSRLALARRLDRGSMRGLREAGEAWSL